jgi:hypothetical protein
MTWNLDASDAVLIYWCSTSAERSDIVIILWLIVCYKTFSHKIWWKSIHRRRDICDTNNTVDDIDYRYIYNII